MPRKTNRNRKPAAGLARYAIAFEGSDASTHSADPEYNAVAKSAGEKISNAPAPLPPFPPAGECAIFGCDNTAEAGWHTCESCRAEYCAGGGLKPARVRGLTP